MGGKLLAVVDTYDALISKRPYHQALTKIGEVKEIMATMVGKKLDQELLDKFWDWKTLQLGRVS